MNLILNLHRLRTIIPKVIIGMLLLPATNGFAFNDKEKTHLYTLLKLYIENTYIKKENISADVPISYNYIEVESKYNCQQLAIYADKLGHEYFLSGNFEYSLIAYRLAFQSYFSSGNTYNTGKSLVNMGLNYHALGDLNNAYKHAMYASLIYYNTNNAKGLSIVYHLMGLINTSIGNYTIALDHYKRSLFFKEKSYESINFGDSYNNIGVIFDYLGNLDSAHFYFMQAFINYQTYNNNIGKINALNNLGEVARKKSNTPIAVKYYRNSLQICEDLNNDFLKIVPLINLGNIEREKKNYNIALSYLIKALKLAEKNKMLENQINAYESIYILYRTQHDVVNAFETYQKFNTLKDSLLNIEKLKQIGDLENKYREQQRKNELELVKYKYKKQVQFSRYEKIIRFFLLAGLLLLIIICVFIFILFRKNVRKNRAIAMKNTKIKHQAKLLQKHITELRIANAQISDNNIEIRKKSDEISELYRNMLKSMEYARLIQASILPDLKEITNAFPESFVLFLPKKIVSGDYYWFEEYRNESLAGSEHLFFAAVFDCCGHGVPGAFLSFICNKIFNEIVHHRGVHNPELILKLMNEQISLLFNNENKLFETSVDVCLCKIFKNDKGSKVVFAGAKRPLIYFKAAENKICFIKGNPYSIGEHAVNNFNNQFTSSEIFLSKGDAIYLTSDGFADQGGPEGKKLGRKNLLHILQTISYEKMCIQAELLHNELKNWKNSQIQRDDITIFALKC